VPRCDPTQWWEAKRKRPFSTRPSKRLKQQKPEDSRRRFSLVARTWNRRKHLTTENIRRQWSAIVLKTKRPLLLWPLPEAREVSGWLPRRLSLQLPTSNTQSTQPLTGNVPNLAPTQRFLRAIQLRSPACHQLLLRCRRLEVRNTSLLFSSELQFPTRTDLSLSRFLWLPLFTYLVVSRLLPL